MVLFVKYMYLIQNRRRIQECRNGRRVNDYDCFMQKDTQPNQTCSEGCTFLLLYVAGVFLCIWGVVLHLSRFYGPRKNDPLLNFIFKLQGANFNVLKDRTVAYITAGEIPGGVSTSKLINLPGIDH